MEITLRGTFKADQLMDELLQAFPSWVIPDPQPEFPNHRKVLLRIKSEAAALVLVLDVPDNADLALLNQVIAAHAPQRESNRELQLRLYREDLGQVLQGFSQALADLEMVENQTFTTMAQLAQAVKRLATIEKQMLKAFRRILPEL